MKKACGIQLAIYAVIAAVIALIVHRRLPIAGPVAAAAVVGGFVVWIGVAYLLGIRSKIQQMVLLRRAHRGDPKRDGEKIAAIGRIVPTGPQLVSPFTKTPCVAYKYEIRRRVDKSEALLCSGVALTPSAVQSVHGAVRLLGNPELKVKPNTLRTEEARSNALQYISATKFREPGLESFSQFWAEQMAVLEDDDGTVRDDHGGARLTEEHLAGARFIEWLVRPGEPVCVIGHYSAQKGGIVPDPQMPLQQVTLERGEPDVFAGRALRGAVGYLIGGLIVLSIAAAALTGFYAFVPLDATEQLAPEMNASWPEIHLERLLERRVRVPMRAAGMLDPNETVTNMVTPGTAHGRVKNGSRDVTVSVAEAAREGDATTIRIDGDAVLLTIDRSERVRNLRLLGTDIPADAIADGLDVQISENDEDTIGGRLMFLSERESLPACRIAFRAVVSR